MKLHEFQAKALLRSAGLAVSPGVVVSTTAQVGAALRKLGRGPWMVKAQVHAGGRGKAGGVRMARTASEAVQIARGLLGKPLVTAQTGPAGVVVRKLLIETATQIARELYLAIVVDRAKGSPVVVASPSGGVEIETLAKEHPEQIFRESVDLSLGLLPFQARRLAQRLGLSASRELRAEAESSLANLVSLFLRLDIMLLEINPWVVTQQGHLLALDAKIILDDSGLFRHPELEKLRDVHQETPSEVDAERHRLNYVGLDGSIGCMVNGAGLAMATMDQIKLAGGRPANFLDVGGGADVGQVREAFRILSQDPKVKAILVNIFGGIVRCDVIAQGMLEAMKKVRLKVPLVVRLEGTNVEEGKRLLTASGVAIRLASGMEEGARMAVEASR